MQTVAFLKTAHAYLLQETKDDKINAHSSNYFWKKRFRL